MKIRRIACQILLVLSVGIVSLSLALEVSLRWLNPVALRLRGQTLILPKNVTYVFENNKIPSCDPIIVQHRNSLGFRGAEPPINGRETLQILTIGGSTTECYYITEGRTWTDLLGVELRKSAPNLWINNAGLDGHSTFGHLLLLRTYVIPLRPDIALFLVGANDIERNDLTKYDLYASSHIAAVPKRSLGQVVMDHSYAASFMANLPRAANAWKGHMGHGTLDLRHVPQEADLPLKERDRIKSRVVQEFLPPYQARVRQLIQECRAHAIEPVFITQPALFGPGRDEATGVDLSHALIQPQRNGQLAWEILELYNNTTRSTAKEENILVIDLAAQMRKSSRYFYDYFHFTNDGAQEVARIVAEGLTPEIKKWQKR